MKVNLQVATLFEAKPLIRLLQLERKRLPGLSHYYENATLGISIWISGIGPSALIKTLPKAVHYLKTDSGLPERWINLGIAGCSQSSVSIGSLFQVATIRLATNSQSLAAQPIISTAPPNKHFSDDQTRLPIAEVITCDHAVSLEAEEQTNDQNIEKIYDSPPSLFDMESYHWACKLTTDYRIPADQLACFKVVSDHASDDKIDFRAIAPLYDAAAEDLLKRLSFI